MTSMQELVNSDTVMLKDTIVQHNKAKWPHNGEQGGEAEGHGDAQVCGGAAVDSLHAHAHHRALASLVLIPMFYSATMQKEFPMDGRRET